MHAPAPGDLPQARCVPTICVALKNIIDEATHSIDFAMYGMHRQPQLLSALLGAQRRGVRVRGIVDRQLNGKYYYRDTPMWKRALHNVRDDYQTDQRQDKRFKTKPRWQRPPFKFNGNLMHNKFFVVDRRWVWTGSANVSPTGVGGYNTNIVALIDAPPLAQQYTNEFEQMYIADRYHGEKRQLPNPPVWTDHGTIKVYFSPQTRPAQSAVIPILRNAQEGIDIMMFFLTHKKIARVLAHKQRAKVPVRVILDAVGAANSYSQHHYLRQQGVKVKVENWGGKMHAKSAIIDGDTLIVGSMNWSRSGSDYNDENTLVIHRAPTLARQARHFFNRLWKSIPQGSEDISAEAFASGTACSDNIDNDFDRQIDDDDEDCAAPIFE